MKHIRQSGILLPVFSLPGKYGIGSLGAEAKRWVKMLANGGFRLWQVLPLSPTGYGDSPYQSECGFAGNPYFIDLPTLCKQGLLTADELASAEREQGRYVDYGDLYRTRFDLLKKAFSRFSPTKDYLRFAKSPQMREYALFRALKEAHGQACWQEWKPEFRNREPVALARFRRERQSEIAFTLFLQYEFFTQWQALKSYANRLGVSILGDLPLYLSYDSVEVWAHPGLFLLDGEKHPEKVAGVPPDYFSRTGQLWGNPVYDWESQKSDGYRWWRARIRRNLQLFDYLRIDHFRGLDRYYAIPANENTAVNGRWYDGPKTALFRGMKSAKIVAEDLGTTDDSLLRFLAEAGYPGMRVLSFMFDGNPQNPHLPANYVKNSVAYTGTHDNLPLLALFEGAKREVLAGARDVTGEILANECKKAGVCKPNVTPKDRVRASLELVLRSKSDLAVLSFTDAFCLGNGATVNRPGESDGKNWRTRLLPTEFSASRLAKFKTANLTAHRLGK